MGRRSQIFFPIVSPDVLEVDSVSNAADTGGSDTHTVSLNNTAVTNVVLQVRVSHDEASGIDNVTYNAVAMDLVSEIGSGDARVGIFELVAPASGTNDVVVTYNDTNIDSIVSAFTYENVDQTTPTGTPTDSSGSGTSVSGSKAISEGDLLIDVICVDFSSGLAVTATDQVEDYHLTEFITEGAGSHSSDQTAGSPSMAWSWTSSSSFARIMVVLNKA